MKWMSRKLIQNLYIKKLQKETSYECLNMETFIWEKSPPHSGDVLKCCAPEIS